MKGRKMFQGSLASADVADGVETARVQRAKGGRATRWENDAIDLKSAGSSVHHAAKQLLDAFQHNNADPRRARELLEYSLDQAALAVGLLLVYLNRHGRDAVRPELDEETGDELDEKQKRARARRTKLNKKRRALRKKLKLCIACPEPAQPVLSGYVHCKLHHEQHAVIVADNRTKSVTYRKREAK
jgi:hypothetical protein